MNYFDTHCHLDDERFEADRDAVVLRALEQGVQTILTLGIDRATSERSLELASQFDSVYAAVGIQPNSVVDAGKDDWQAIERWASDDRVVALGESGLDRYWDRTPFSLQEEYFQRHLQLAFALKKPIVIHCREAEAEVLSTLQTFVAKQGEIKGVMHSFCGTWDYAQAFLELGLYLSIAGMVTYKSAADLRAVAQQIPRERLLIETDAPYLAPVPHRGKRNEPAFLTSTARFLAELKQVSVEELAQTTTQNAVNLFSQVQQ